MKNYFLNVLHSFERVIAIGVGISTIVLFLDLKADINQGFRLEHIVLEITAFLFCVGITCYALLTLWNKEREKIVVLQNKLVASEEEKEKWKSEAQSFIKGLQNSIEKQFNLWRFTDSEKDIGLLILKGLSHKEIADIRKTNEKTVRQQATCIYNKSKLSGKGELFAFFLEDLLSPNQK